MIHLLLFPLYNLHLYLQESCSKSVVETRSIVIWLRSGKNQPGICLIYQPNICKTRRLLISLFKKSGDFNLNREILKPSKKRRKKKERSRLICLPLNAGVFSIQCMLL